MYVIKRDGSKQEFDFNKIKNAVNKAFIAVHNSDAPDELIDYLYAVSKTFEDGISIENVQDVVEDTLMTFK